MQISSLNIVEALKGKLLEYPALVDGLHNKDFEFLALLNNWMRETETILRNNNISRCSEIAALRSRVIAPLFSESQKRSKKKLQLQIAAEILYELQATVVLVMTPFEKKVDEAREVLVYLLTLLKQSNAIRFQPGADFQSFINQIWQLFLTHEQLKASAVKILTLVSQNDALRIIAEEIILDEWR